MKNKFGMEIIPIIFTVRIKGEETELKTMENEIVEDISDDIKYNDVYKKILTIDNCKKLVANNYKNCQCEYTYDEIINMKDEDFLMFQIFSFSKIKDNYYQSNTFSESLESQEAYKIEEEQLMLDDYMDWLYSHPHELRIYNNLKDTSFKIEEEDAYREGIYKIQFKNDIYIGQTNNLIRRFTQHKDGKNNTRKEITKLLKDGGVFELLEFEDNKNQRLIKEKDYIDEYIKNGYNLINIINKYPKTRKNSITFDKSDLDKITKLLLDNNINFKPHKFRDKLEEK